MKTTMVILVCILLALVATGCSLSQQQTGPTSVTLTNYPNTVTEGQKMQISWDIGSSSAGNAAATGIYYDIVSHPGALDSGISPSNAGYSASSLLSGSQAIPGIFNTMIPVPAGINNIYLRAFAKIDDNYYWSDEAVISVKAAAAQANTTQVAQSNVSTNASNATPIKVDFVSAPDSGVVGEPVTFSWRIDSPSGNTSHTAVHYGNMPVLNPQGPSDYPSASQFLCTQTACKIPGNFSTEITFNQAGTYYYRAHTVVDGKNYWSIESTITINDRSASPPSLNFSVSIQNYSYSPSPQEVPLGATVTWTNNDNIPHTVTSDSGDELSSSTLQPGDTYTHTFNTAGMYSYHCNIHQMMKGTVIVEGASSQSSQNLSLNESSGQNTSLTPQGYY